ncbi:MAG: hypothetical protein ABUJ92_06670 [Desulfobacterales bacterium]
MYSKATIRKNAKVDGKKNFPDRDDPNFSPFEMEVMAKARKSARETTAKYAPKMDVLNGKHKPMLKDYERISKDYDNHSSKIGRTEPSVELSRGKYYPLMLLFVLGEIPMNSLAFSVFGESQIFTWIMAVGVAVAIPWIAHAMGILLKRGSDPWWKNAIGIGVLLVLTVGGLIAIGYVRVQYLGDLSTSGAIGSFGSSKFIGAAFVGLNLVILAAATLCSYFAHDTDSMLQHLHRRTNKLNKSMRALEAKYKKIQTNKNQEVDKIKQRVQEVIALYRKVNHRVRLDHSKPKSFEREHELGPEFEEEDEKTKMETMTTRMQAIPGQSSS